MSGRRRVRVAGIATLAGTYAVLGFTQAIAPRSHADFEDPIFQPIMEALDQTATAIDAGSVLDTTSGDTFVAALTAWWNASPLGQETDQLLAALSGDDGVSSAPAVTGSDTPDTATIPLSMDSTSFAQGAFTVPMVNLSVGGGASVPVEVDTGSNGLVLPASDVPWTSFFQASDGFGTAEYYGNAQGGLHIFYDRLPETVNFTTSNGQVITDKTDVDVVLFSWPENWSFAPGTVWTFQQMMSVNEGNQNGGILGIGPDALGPNTGPTPTAGLPGDLGQGVLIDERGGYLQFAAAPTGLGTGVTVDGVDSTSLQMTIGDGALEPVQQSFIDSGGGYGVVGTNLLPSDLSDIPVGGQLPVGTPISVYNNDGDLLYSYTTGPVQLSGGFFPVFNNGPSVVAPATTDSPVQFNTGYEAFQHGPVYISNVDGGSATFYPGIS